jgi:hypothetical protein
METGRGKDGADGAKSPSKKENRCPSGHVYSDEYEKMQVKKSKF